MTVCDGENLIFISPENKTMNFEGHILNLFKKSISWRFRYCSKVKVTFDQHGFSDDLGEIMKTATNLKRYGSELIENMPAAALYSYQLFCGSV